MSKWVLLKFVGLVLFSTLLILSCSSNEHPFQGFPNSIMESVNPEPRIVVRRHDNDIIIGRFIGENSGFTFLKTDSNAVSGAAQTGSVNMKFSNDGTFENLGSFRAHAPDVHYGEETGFLFHAFTDLGDQFHAHGFAMAWGIHGAHGPIEPIVVDQSPIGESFHLKSMKVTSQPDNQWAIEVDSSKNPVMNSTGRPRFVKNIGTSVHGWSRLLVTYEGVDNNGNRVIFTALIHELSDTDIDYLNDPTGNDPIVFEFEKLEEHTNLSVCILAWGSLYDSSASKHLSVSLESDSSVF